MTSEMIMFIVGFLVITVGMMFGLSFVKNQKVKNNVLKLFAWSCFIWHISIMWQTSLSNGGTGTADRSILWPVYFCNVTMYLLLIVAIMKKDSKAFKLIATFTAYAGIIGALVTFFDYKYPFSNDGGLYSFERLKSTISHALLLVGGVYLFVGGWVKVRFKNTPLYLLGLLFNGFIGGILNWFFMAKGINPNMNAMWLRQTALAGEPIFTGVTIGLISLGLVALISIIWELIAVPLAKKKGRNDLYFWQELKIFFSNFKANVLNPKFLITSIIILLFGAFTLTMVIIQTTVYAL